MNFDTTYLQLPSRFYTKLSPTPVAGPGPIRVNVQQAEQLEIDGDWLASPEGTEVLALQEQTQRLLGPTTGRLESEFLNPLILRSFAIMARSTASGPKHLATTCSTTSSSGWITPGCRISTRLPIRFRIATG